MLDELVIIMSSNMSYNMIVYYVITPVKPSVITHVNSGVGCTKQFLWKLMGLHNAEIGNRFKLAAVG